MTDRSNSGRNERKRYLATLLDRLSAPADVMRQHMQHEHQNAALGLAAEAGVRELLRLVLPRRLAVSSGFLRAVGSSLHDESPPGAMSPQTDVILYDASRAAPLHTAGGIDIVAASDVLGVIEVKDTAVGSEDLGPGEGKALAHVAALAVRAPMALRAIVLFRGNRARRDPPEIERAREIVAAARMMSYELPHVIYCTSYPGGDRDDSYIAYHDYRAQAMRFQEYQGDPTSALAGFLRIVTGFLAVQGLIAPSFHLDLTPELPARTAGEVPVASASAPFETLHASLAAMTGESALPRYNERLRSRIERDPPYSVLCRIVTGSDARGLPTAGAILLIQWEDRAKPMAAAFFYPSAPDVFTCTDAADAEPWTLKSGMRIEELARSVLVDQEAWDRPPRAMNEQTGDGSSSHGKDST